MKATVPIIDHVSRRAFLKATMLTTTGLLVPNRAALFASQIIAAQARRQVSPE